MHAEYRWQPAHGPHRAFRSRRWFLLCAIMVFFVVHAACAGGKTRALFDHFSSQNWSVCEYVVYGGILPCPVIYALLSTRNMYPLYFPLSRLVICVIARAISLLLPTQWRFSKIFKIPFSYLFARYANYNSNHFLTRV